MLNVSDRLEQRGSVIYGMGALLGGCVHVGHRENWAGRSEIGFSYRRPRRETEEEVIRFSPKRRVSPIECRGVAVQDADGL